MKVSGCISAYGICSFHVLEGTINAKRYMKVLEQHIVPSRQRLFQGRPCVFQQDNATQHIPAIITPWLHWRRAWCWLGLPALQIFHLSRIFGISLKWKTTTTNSPISGKNGTEFQHQNSRNSKPECPDVFKLFWTGITNYQHWQTYSQHLLTPKWKCEFLIWKLICIFLIQIN